MKFSLNLLIPSLLFITSCSYTNYQVIELSRNQSEQNKASLITRDENCTINYDFWGNGGEMYMTITNTSSKYIYIHLDESFFILNGFAKSYFQSSVVSLNSSSSTGNMASRSTSQGSSFGILSSLRSTSSESSSSISSTQFEEQIMIIPPNSYRVINRYLIQYSTYRHCDLTQNVTKEASELEFDKENSPFKIRNIIRYTLEGEDKSRVLEDAFYASSITNYPEKKAFGYDNIENCGQVTQTSSRVFIIDASNRYYLKYNITY